MTTQNMGCRLARSRRMCSQDLSVEELADDVALIVDAIEGTKLLLDSLDNAALSVGLAVNYCKTKFMTQNIPGEESSLVGNTGNMLEKVKDFVYLDSDNSEGTKDQES